VELLRARGRDPAVEMVERAPRTFASREELETFLRRQLWVEPGGAADLRFRKALDGLVAVDDEGAVRLRDQPALAIGVVTWDPRGVAA
jgi:hypothetical protein